MVKIKGFFVFLLMFYNIAQAEQSSLGVKNLEGLYEIRLNDGTNNFYLAQVEFFSRFSVQYLDQSRKEEMFKMSYPGCVGTFSIIQQKPMVVATLFCEASKSGVNNFKHYYDFTGVDWRKLEEGEAQGFLFSSDLVRRKKIPFTIRRLLKPIFILK